jgi:hypothetical protein
MKGIIYMLSALIVMLLLSVSVLSGVNPIPDPKDDNPTEPAGLWQLKDVQIKNEKCNWKGTDGELTLYTKWNDFLQIQHIIDCKLRWTNFPSLLRPDTDLEFSTEFINKEYSTTSNLQTGIRLILTGIKPVKIFELNKNFNNHQTETKTVKVLIPKHNETKELKITVECFSGQAKYSTIYSYVWIND